jgi:hypothetical protein
MVKGTCSFCLKEDLRVVQGNGVAICPACVKSGVTKLLPKEGDIMCDQCGTATPSVLLKFSTGAQMIFMATSMDETEAYVYTLVATGGSWNQDTILYTAHCRVCSAKLDNKKILSNKHVKQFLIR